MAGAVQNQTLGRALPELNCFLKSLVLSRAFKVGEKVAKLMKKSSFFSSHSQYNFPLKFIATYLSFESLFHGDLPLVGWTFIGGFYVGNLLEFWIDPENNFSFLTDVILNTGVSIVINRSASRRNWAFLGLCAASLSGYLSERDYSHLT